VVQGTLGSETRRENEKEQEERRMKLYLSGKMTGLPDHGFPIFNAEAARLRALGYEVINPAETQPSTDWIDCIKLDLESIRECDGIALMGNWVDSYGAIIEVMASERLQNVIFKAAEIVDHISTFSVIPSYKIDMSKIADLLIPA